MIYRHLSPSIQKAAKHYPVVAVTGPYRSGKTTLCRELFPDYEYVNLERLEMRDYAQSDPNGFLTRFQGKIIIDEAQRVPELFSSIMVTVDENRRKGEFILTGSQNFHLMESISQSLAGRCATFKLLPFSSREIASEENPDLFHLSEAAHPAGKPDCYVSVFKGGYPPLYDTDVDPTEWLGNYTRTYLERDVRTLTNVGDLGTFERFLRLCAGRTGQILDMTSLGNDAGVSTPTVKRWLSLLSASYTIFLLQPHQKNFNKRLIKSPKLYFYDTGLVCYLLGIRSPDELRLHSQRGNIFETFVVSEFFKCALNAGKEPSLYFWRDTSGHEVDLLLEDGEKLLPIEIKSGQTVSGDMFGGLDYYSKLNGNCPGMLIYGGSDFYTRSGMMVRPWNFI